MPTFVPQGFSSFTARTTPNNTAWSSVAWSPTLNLFVAVSYSGIASPVLTSPTGVTWTARAAGSAAHLWNDVIWVPELALFVAVSDVSGLATNVMTSANGTTWTARTAPDTGWGAVAWNGTTLVAVSYNNTNNVMTSTDGITWTAQTSTGILTGLDDIAWSSTLSLFVGCNAGQNIYSSANGIAWTVREIPSGATCIGRVAWAASLATFFVLSNGLQPGQNSGVYASTDGITWTYRPFNSVVNTSYAPKVIMWAESVGRLVTLGESTTTVLMSVDGTTWTLTTGLSNYWYAAVWSPALLMMAMVSTDTVDMDDVATAIYNALPSVTGLTYLEGKGIAVVGDGIVIASPNNPKYDPPIVVTGGTVTLPAGTYTTVHVGLPYVTDIETLDLDMAESTVKPGKFLVTGVGVYVEDSLGFFAGSEEPTTATNLTLPGGGSLQPIQVLDRNETAVTTMQSGFRLLHFEGRWAESGSVFIRHLDPSPLTVLALAPYGARPSG